MLNISSILRRKNRNICGFWDCKKRIPDEDFLCREHYEAWEKGAIDQCPKCERFKEIMYPLCLDCYFGRRVTPWKSSVVIPPRKQHYRVEYSEAWVDPYLRPDKFFVYVVRLDDDNLHVGRTTDLRKRIREYREQGRNPVLDYLHIVATEEAAELRESELKGLISSNPEQMDLMISEFHGHMRELGFE